MLRHRPGRRRRARLVAGLLALVLVAGAVTVVVRILYPRTDSPAHVDGIVVVAGAEDDRYVYARALAEEGVADQILVSRAPATSWPSYDALLDQTCASSLILARNGRTISLDCFASDPETTEGETVAATRIARERGWKSLLVVTYWGHVSRVRLYFEQCFDGDVYVTDTPRPLMISRKHAVLHESAGYVKALIRPAC